MDIEQHLIRHMAFSRAAFGPGARTQDAMQALEDALVLVQRDGSASAWAEVVWHALDGLTRAAFAEAVAELGGTVSHDYAARAAENEILLCQSERELRKWPDWRTAAIDGVDQTERVNREERFMDGR